MRASGDPSREDTGAGSAKAPDSGDARARLRRRDRGQSEAWIRSFLKQAPFGVLGTADEDGHPFLNSNLFVFDEERHCLYLHTHRTGRTRSNVERCEKVVFTVAAMGRMLPADKAIEFSVEYAGVVVFGTAHVVDDAEEAEHGLRELLEKYAPHLEYGTDYRGVTAEELARTTVYRVDIEAWSGKRLEASTDFPGAYEMPTPPVSFLSRRTVPEA